MRRTFLTVAMLVLAGLVLIRASDPLPVEAVREGYFDTLQRLSPRSADGLPVRIVDIDEAALARIGQWPWPRTRMAEMVGRLTDLGAAVVVFDVLFAEPDRMSPGRILSDPSLADAFDLPELAAGLAGYDNDVLLADAMMRGAVVLGVADGGATGGAAPVAKPGFVEVGAAPAAALPTLASVTPLVPVLEAAALGVGGINVSRGSTDATVREVPLVWRTDAGMLPSLAVEALRVALGEGTLILMGIEQGAGLDRLRLGGYDIPTAEDGTIRVRYRPDDPALYVSAADLLDPGGYAALAPVLSGHIVFVGTSAAGLLDIRTTALGERVPGVSIHAQIVEQILTETYLTRSDVIQGLEILALVATGLVVTLVMAFGGAVWSVAAGGLAGAGVVLASWLAFTRGDILLDATFPLFGGFAAFSALAMFQYIVSDRERRMIRRSFSKYVSNDVLAEIERRGHSLELGGEIREVTVMFSDIRDFTPLSERMGPQDLVALLNRLFTDLTDEILAARGTIDKYIGDSIMAFWNAPLPTPDHPARACEAALKMRVSLARFNAGRAARGDDPVRVTLGLAAGPVCVGNIGSQARYNYSVVGDTVNRAARIEAMCRHVAFDILIGDEVARAAGALALLDAGRLGLKGVSQRHPTWIVVGDAGTARSAGFRELRAAHGALLAALSDGASPDAALARCRSLASDVLPGLSDFYERVPARADDFR